MRVGRRNDRCRRTDRFSGSDVYRALVRNRAKLAYNGVAAWLEGDRADAEGDRRGRRASPRTSGSRTGWPRRLKTFRHDHGALTLETIEARLVFDADELKDVDADKGDRAQDIIENFMIGANGVTSRFLASRQLPSLRRVVRTPKRWDRIVELAAEKRFTLPDEPDSKALETFLTRRRRRTRCGFPIFPLP